eukprot:gene18047-21543_t
MSAPSMDIKQIQGGKSRISLPGLVYNPSESISATVNGQPTVYSLIEGVVSFDFDTIPSNVDTVVQVTNGLTSNTITVALECSNDCSFHGNTTTSTATTTTATTTTTTTSTSSPTGNPITTTPSSTTTTEHPMSTSSLAAGLKIKKIDIKDPSISGWFRPGDRSQAIRQYTRLDVACKTVQELNLVNSTNPVVQSYDLVSILPLTPDVFNAACNSSYIDIITITPRTTFSLVKPAKIRQALNKGEADRFPFYQMAASIIRAAFGKNIILSSHAKYPRYLRGPYDIANLGNLFGMTFDQARAAVSTHPHSAVLHGAARRAQQSMMALTADTKSLAPLQQWKQQTPQDTKPTNNTTPHSKHINKTSVYEAQGCTGVRFDFTTRGIANIDSITSNNPFVEVFPLAPKITNADTDTQLYSTTIKGTWSYGTSYLNFIFVSGGLTYNFNKVVTCDSFILNTGEPILVPPASTILSPPGLMIPKNVFIKIPSLANRTSTASTTPGNIPLTAKCQSQGVSIPTSIAPTVNSYTNGEFEVIITPIAPLDVSVTFIQCAVSNGVAQQQEFNIPVQSPTNPNGTLVVPHRFPSDNMVVNTMNQNYRQFIFYIELANFRSQVFVTYGSSGNLRNINMPLIPVYGNITDGWYYLPYDTVVWNNWQSNFAKINPGESQDKGQDHKYQQNERPALCASGTRDKHTVVTTIDFPNYIRDDASYISFKCPFQSTQLTLITEAVGNSVNSIFETIDTMNVVWKLIITDTSGSGFLMVKSGDQVLVKESDLQLGDLTNGIYEKIIPIQEIRKLTNIVIVDRVLNFANILFGTVYNPNGNILSHPDHIYDITFNDIKSASFKYPQMDMGANSAGPFDNVLAPVIGFGAYNFSTQRYEIPFTLPKNMVQQFLNYTLITPREIKSMFLPAPGINITTRVGDQFPPRVTGGTVAHTTTHVTWTLDFDNNISLNKVAKGYGYINSNGLVPIPFNLTKGTDYQWTIDITYSNGILCKSPLNFSIGYLYVEDEYGYYSEVRIPGQPITTLDTFFMLYSENEVKFISVTIPCDGPTPVLTGTIKSPTVSVSSVDVGSSSRSFSVTFTAIDNAGIDFSTLPSLFVTSLSYQWHQSPCNLTSSDVNRLFADYKCQVDLPYGFGAGGIGQASVTPLRLHASGCTNIHRMSFGSEIIPTNSLTRTFTLRPMITGNLPISVNGGKLVLLGQKLSNVQEIKIIPQDTTNKPLVYPVSIASGVYIAATINPYSKPFTVEIFANGFSATSELITPQQSTTPIFTPSPTPSITTPPTIPPSPPPISCPNNCNGHGIIVLPPVIDEAMPTTITTDPDEKYEALVSVVSVLELEQSGKVVAEHTFKQWKVTKVADPQSDGRPTVITNTLMDDDYQPLDSGADRKPSSFIAINVPHFTSNVIIDPQFNMLIEPSTPSGCGHSSGLTKNQIIGIAVACGLAGVVAISVTAYCRSTIANNNKSSLQHPLILAVAPKFHFYDSDTNSPIKEASFWRFSRKSPGTAKPVSNHLPHKFEKFNGHPSTGYVQGINDLATPFIYVFLSEFVEDIETCVVENLDSSVLAMVEADCYWCLTKLLDGIQDHYTFAQPGIQRMIAQLKGLLETINSRLCDHLKAQDAHFIEFAFRWMNCLLMREIPFLLIIRMWDTYLCEREGFSVFHVYVCAAFLVLWSDELCHKDFPDIMIFLQKPPTVNWEERDIEDLFSTAHLYRELYHNAQSHLRSSSSHIRK